MFRAACGYGEEDSVKDGGDPDVLRELRIPTALIDPTLCRRELLAEHPFAWLVEINGLVVDVRRLPVEMQIEAHRRGFIPTRPGAA